MYEYTYIIIIVHIVLQCVDILVLYMKYVYLLRKYSLEKFLYCFVSGGSRCAYEGGSRA